ncbi:hypothetical protein QBC40DRAFT_316028 [Triangularia verruculosa]|uniref:Uncharacterized protein n=1 Tax=Triangularia verruculosa TaxID=2587418 RepID=A0AAN7AS06_9PEZI|nr:hypothetical protein QBC40DRAFT_316028 [Triangularia verruculosa]
MSFDFSVSLLPENAEESTTRLKNELDEFGNPKPHRRDITGYDRTGKSALIAFNGSMPIFLHGTLGDVTDPLYTLAHIEVTFTAHADRGDAEPLAEQYRRSGGLDSYWDPEVVSWAPASTTWYHKTEHTVSTSHSVEVSATAELAPFLSCGPKYTWTRSDEGAQRIAAIKVVGDKFYGKGRRTHANGVRWDLVENEATHSGVPSELRTAVLLRRRPMDTGQFLGEVKIRTSVSALHDLREKWWAAVGNLLEDDPVVFDPLQPDRPGVYGGLKDKLADFEIQSSAQVKTIVDNG